MFQHLLLVAPVLVTLATLAPADEPKSSLSKEERDLLGLINTARAGKKAPELQPNPKLCEVARTHAAAMAKQKKLVTRIEGKPTLDKQTGAAGYDAKVWSANFGYSGFIGVETIYDGWAREDGSHRNLSNPQARDVGLAIVQDGDKDGFYCVAIFAAKK